MIMALASQAQRLLTSGFFKYFVSENHLLVKYLVGKCFPHNALTVKGSWPLGEKK